MRNTAGCARQAFGVEEVEDTIRKQKRGMSAGPDGILPEYLFNGGQKLSMVNKNLQCHHYLESVPACFTEAIPLQAL